MASPEPTITDDSIADKDAAAAAAAVQPDDGADSGPPTPEPVTEPPATEPSHDDEEATTPPPPEEAPASNNDAAATTPPESIHVPNEYEADNQGLQSPTEKSSSWAPQEVQKGNNLIVNYVPRSFTDQTLYELFIPFGEIESARAIIDRQTGQCQGYGFVKFASKEAAASAVAHFQTAAPDSRQLKVHFARPSSTHKQCNIYITGLPINFTEADTAALFEPYGPVVECKILMGKDGESRGCGFVRLSDVAKTHAAIAALNESVPPGGSSRITVSLAAGTRKETQQFPAPGAAAYRGAATAAYPPATQPYYPQQQPAAYPQHPYYQALNPYGAAQPPQQYGYYGAPVAQQFGRYPQSYGAAAAATGYAPVRHTPVARSETSPYGSGPVITPGPVAPVPPVAPNGGRQLYTGYCLFCFNLPMEYDETALRAIFSQYGNVSSSKVMRDPATGRSKGYGFVNIDTEQQAMAAIQALNGYPLNGKTLKVQFKTHGPVKPAAGAAMMGQSIPPYY